MSFHLTFSYFISPYLTPHPTLPHLTLPHLTLPHLASPHLISSHVFLLHLTLLYTSPYLTPPYLTSPLLFSSHLTLPHLISSHVTLPGRFTYKLTFFFPPTSLPIFFMLQGLFLMRISSTMASFHIPPPSLQLSSYSLKSWKVYLQCWY